jgi:RNA polymerase sigma-70 factor, ECF subfamily
VIVRPQAREHAREHVRDEAAPRRAGQRRHAAPPRNVPRACDRPDVVERLRAGDSAAFDAVYHELVGPLRAWAYRYVRSREAAVEVVHDVFLAVWRVREHLVVRDGLPAYLYAATRNRALDWQAREAARRRVNERAVEESYAGPDGRAADAGEGERAEVLHAIVAAIEAMPERRRVVCSLRWRQGMSLAEIATSLGISQKTVETQLSRGLKQLRDQFQPESAPVSPPTE